MFLPTQADGNPHLKLIEQLAQAQQPVNLLEQNKQREPQRGMFGLRKPDPMAQQKMVDDILGAEMRAPVKHWSQALLRPLMGLVKTQKDAKATEFKEGRERDDANSLINAITGVRSGMDEQGNVDLSGLLSGARNPAMVEAILGYADKAGNTKYNRYDSDRRFTAGREDQQFNRGRLSAADARAAEKHDRDMNAYGEPRQGIGPDGKPVFFQLPPDNGAPRIIEGVTPSSDTPFNRKQTPAEAAKAREILAARRQLASIIEDKGREELQFDSTGNYAELTKIARQSLPGAADPGYDAFLETLTGIPSKAPAPTPDATGAPDAAPKDAGRLIDAGGNRPAQVEGPSLLDSLIGQIMPDKGSDQVKPVPQGGTQSMQERWNQTHGKYGPGMNTDLSAANLDRAPMGQQGTPDFAAMTPGKFYKMMGKNGNVVVFAKRDDGNIEIVYGGDSQ